MDREFENIIEMLKESDEEVKIIECLVAYARKYHRRISEERLKNILSIVIETLSRDVSLKDSENFIMDNFDYYMMNFLKIENTSLEKFKYKFMNRDFDLEDMCEILSYVRENIGLLSGELDFLLRIPESAFKNDLEIKTINEFNPSRERWMRLLQD